MLPRPNNIDISGATVAFGGNASTGGRTPRRPNFHMDLPSPRVGEVPPALSPLDAFALHSRALARRLEESSRAGRRMSRLPHHEIESELAKRPGYFRSLSSGSDLTASDIEDEGDDDDEERDRERAKGEGHKVEISPKDERPVSQYPYLGNAATDRFSGESIIGQPSTAAPKSQPSPIKENDELGYFGIGVPRSSSPEPFDPQSSKPALQSPALPSLTSSYDSIGSSNPRSLTNESSHSRIQGGLAPPRSPLRPRSERSIASIRSVMDSGEEDNGSTTAPRRIGGPPKPMAGGAHSHPYSPLSPEFLPVSCSPSAMSEVSINEPLPTPSFNFSRPRSSSTSKHNYDRRPSFDTRPINRKTSNGSSLREAISANHRDGDTHSKADTLSIRSRQNSGAASDTLSRIDTRSTMGGSRQNPNSPLDTLSVRGPSRQNSGGDAQPVRRGPPSRQTSGSATDPRLMRGPPSRQNSSEARSIRGPPSRQNSGGALSKTDTRSTRGPLSRQNSGEAHLRSETPSVRGAPGSEGGSVSEMELEPAHGDSRDPHDPRFHNDPRDRNDPRDPRNTGAQSYIYSKYSLPRGRTVERGLAEQRNSLLVDAPGQDEAAAASPARKAADHHDQLLSPALEAYSPSIPTTPNREHFPSSINRSRSAEPPSGAGAATNASSPSSPAVSSHGTEHTVRGRTHLRNSPSLDIAGLSPDEHLERGIQAHNSGSLSKSTYHLRLAARAGLPTAMLLYALACRHGWGMRPNQAEGVSWLKRAVDSSSLEFIADNDPLSATATGQKLGPMTAEQKTRKAQFALAIYELGMSYMNGWGIPKDKSLALRCFEIAGSWGDNDALAEAGFCYTQGVGCKKDLKKAASYYRRAAEGGMSMAGNSWIYKPKYMDDPVPDKPEAPAAPPIPGDKAVRPAGRSRTKSFFGRRKPPAVV